MPKQKQQKRMTKTVSSRIKKRRNTELAPASTQGTFSMENGKPRIADKPATKSDYGLTRLDWKLRWIYRFAILFIIMLTILVNQPTLSILTGFLGIGDQLSKLVSFLKK